jgi:adenylyltransferase/sulfurtransferase
LSPFSRYEHEIARIPGSRLIPLKELPRRLGELDPRSSIVVHCKMGGRSAQATRILKDAGFAKVRNLTGGILAWSRDVDASVPRY